MNINFVPEEEEIIANMARAELRIDKDQVRWCVRVYSELRKLPQWRKVLDERMEREVDFCEQYKRDYNHGAPGHTHMILIAILAEELDRLHGMIQSRIQE